MQYSNESQYPNFTNLLQKISQKLNDDLSSEKEQSKYRSSISILTRERKSFLRKRILHNICEEYTAGGTDENRKIVEEAMAASKLQQIVNVNHNGRKFNLANINSDDLTNITGNKNVNAIITPVIEEEVERRINVVKSFCNTSTPRAVSNTLHNNGYNRSKLCQMKSDIASKQLEYIKKAEEALKVFDKVATLRTRQEAKDCHMDRVTALSALSTKLNLMVANLEANVVSDTYTADSVAALKVIHRELEERQRALERESSHAAHMLSAYLSLGEEFSELVDLYTELRGQLETYKWALDLKQA